MVQEYIEKLTSFLFMHVEPEEMETLEVEKEFLAVDAILSCMQAYRMIERKAYVNMPDIVLFAEIEPIEDVNNELVMRAGFLRQGVETDVENFYTDAIDFCGRIISLLSQHEENRCHLSLQVQANTPFDLSSI